MSLSAMEGVILPIKKVVMVASSGVSSFADSPSRSIICTQMVATSVGNCGTVEVIAGLTKRRAAGTLQMKDSEFC